MEGSLHKYRAEQNNRGGDAKNFQSIVSHTRSVGRMRSAAHRTEAYVTMPPVGLDSMWKARPAGPAVIVLKVDYWGAALDAAAPFFLPIGDALASLYPAACASASLMNLPCFVLPY